MFKDYDKYLRESLKVYLFLLIIIFILKLVGLDYFGLEVNDPRLIKISNYLSNTHWGDVYCFATTYLLIYFYMGLATNKSKRYISSFITTLILYILQCILNVYYKIDGIYPILCLIAYIIAPMIVLKKLCIKRQVQYIILINIYQLFSLFIRNIGIYGSYNNFLIDSLINIDQILLLAITYNISIMKGEIE